MEVKMVVKEEILGLGGSAKVSRGRTYISCRLGPGGLITPAVEVKTSTDKWFLVEAVEEGGGATNTGFAQVVCGTEGQMLRPYYVPKGYSNSTHALFSAKRLVVITATKKRDNVSITAYRFDYGDGRVFLVEEKVWESEDLPYHEKGGISEVIPRSLIHFQLAVEAALGKAHCYHCRDLHYAASRSRGESGPARKSEPRARSW